MEWAFDGGRPCLDLVNTLRNRYAPEGVEMLTSPEKLAEWLSLAGLTDGQVPVTEEDLENAKWLREAVNRLVTTQPARPDVDLVNKTADEPLPNAHLHLAGGELRRTAPTPRNPVAAALARIATDVVELVTSPVDVRVCAAEDCGLRFADASPRRTRQWCSMSRCGNRAKARAHYARTRG
ncbi:CGNR zinc finger domain-containing protein [Amycolatopsis rhabdoformis]|uniref:CGNR zinc finger domain-containing protein n=1 Tax=Amycolatopsis rhabdoformis TaxID=1448059 RepID=A0ABZ1I3D4_9PSEU|nr:CGNR zinc finger domain-containing protein [Amycolatopsis rhabdoformis]WSE28887.1 CGNR zinc finger domain-containing protein [Amycolatopsis rhabdoformis]